MDDMRGAKLITCAILVAAGGLSIGLGNHREGPAMLVGVVLVLTGIPLLVMQWRGARRKLPDLDDERRSSDTGFRASKDLEI